MPRVERPAMSDYGVPSDIEGALPWEWATERLTANRNYWVVTVDADGKPHSMPVWGVWHTDETFWFSCAPSALKSRNIAVNPHVVVTTSDTVEVVSVEGVARAADVPRDVAVEWAEKYHDANDTSPVAQSVDELAEFFAANAAFQVVPHKAIGMIERAEEFAERATRWSWAQ
ncbi:MAG TPA: pyridoxamine 5'-phosphate oxidase family protein [Ilumatobacter sp.]|nr:pyridoxamine 5'-phosphate oxidase family protein [Ilumatobacter sp.]